MKSLSGTTCYFQAAHFLSLDYDKESTENSYGSDWAPKGKGICYKVELATNSGEVKSYRISEYFKLWQDKVLNDNAVLSKKPITIENLALYLFDDIKKALAPPLSYLQLRIWQNDRVFAEVNSDCAHKVTWAKAYGFNSLHRHYNEELSEEENKELYRKCSKLHGHEYLLTIMANGVIDSNSGLLVERGNLDRLVQGKVLSLLHGNYLNPVIGNTSGETLLREIKGFLGPYLAKELSWQLNLRETLKNSFSVNIS